MFLGQQFGCFTAALEKVVLGALVCMCVCVDFLAWEVFVLEGVFCGFRVVASALAP